MKNILLTGLLIFTTNLLAADFYSLKEKDIQGKDFSFKELKGKVVLVVNIASRCGYTPQLETLQKLYEKFEGKNFTILGVPSNEFGGQSPESDQDMAKFCRFNYGVKFPLLKKSIVKGSKKSELYNFLIKNGPHQNEISWNFEKFLVDKNGKVINRFKSGESPLGDNLTALIQNNL